MWPDIKVPYSTKPSMVKRIGPAFRPCADQNRIDAKCAELSRHGELLWGCSLLAKDKNLVARAAQHCGKPYTDNLVDLAMCFEEDLAIMHCGKLEAVCFCFPSGWTPKEKLGLSLADIHRPVGDSEDLVRVSDKLAKTMADSTMGGFQRTVWTVTANPHLNAMPGAYTVSDPRCMDDLYFRWEEQTTEPVSDGLTSLFFVHTHVVPLLSVWTDLGTRIQDSVNSMSAAVLAYKNLRDIKMILNLGR